jgi:hypothetical protein
MRRHLAAIAVVIGTLAAPAAAPAKEISKVAVCGIGGQCTTYDESDFKSLMFLAEDAGPTDPPAAVAPWYRVRFTVDTREEGGGFDRWTVAYVPSANTLRVRNEVGDFAWVALNPRTARVLERAARGLPAFPKAQLRGLHVEPIQARVDEVVTPAARTAPTHDGTPWGWIGAVTLAAALVLLALGWALRRRHQPTAASAAPTAAAAPPT